MRQRVNRTDETGRLLDGYDYDHQAWVQDGRYQPCAHPAEMTCDCYGRLHAGELTNSPAAE